VPATDAVSADPVSGDAPRERRLDARRNLEAIIDAARTTLAADPRASMQEVASNAGLHRATVHRHFASRDDLMATLRGRAFDESLAALRDARPDEGPAPEALTRGTHALLEQGRRWQLDRYSTPFEHTPASEEIDRLVAGLLERGQQEGTVRDDVPAAHLALMWGGMVAMGGVVRDRGLSTDDAARLVVRTLLGPGRPAAE
jgi:TetR/AcrR family transcriptional regulator, mexCD-oprJ operon repressor